MTCMDKARELWRASYITEDDAVRAIAAALNSTEGEQAHYAVRKALALASRVAKLREALGKLLAVVDKQSDALNSDSLSDDEIWEWAGARENARAALKSTNGEPNAN